MGTDHLEPTVTCENGCGRPIENSHPLALQLCEECRHQRNLEKGRLRSKARRQAERGGRPAKVYQRGRKLVPRRPVPTSAYREEPLAVVEVALERIMARRRWFRLDAQRREPAWVR